ncbi:DUF5999 family protein [Streptomyces acidiscabies]|uniref:DUF5999 family protein n=1 Tax=Streptomyces acidiscabies TaxID=42234 RepID=UPI0038F74A2E
MNIRALRGWWNDVLGAACVVEDVVSTVRSHRLTTARTRTILSSDRATALITARQGCTHTPPCPPAGAPDRTKAAEIYADASCIYLCNGIVLSASALTAPDSPSGLPIPTPTPQPQEAP